LPLYCGTGHARIRKRVSEVQAILLAIVIQLLGKSSIYRTEGVPTDHHLARIRLVNATTTSSITHVHSICIHITVHCIHVSAAYRTNPQHPAIACYLCPKHPQAPLISSFPFHFTFHRRRRFSAGYFQSADSSATLGPKGLLLNHLDGINLPSWISRRSLSHFQPPTPWPRWMR
jgi:hypothetical protein